MRASVTTILVLAFHLRIPTGFQPSAQRLRGTSYPGSTVTHKIIFNPNAGCILLRHTLMKPRWGFDFIRWPTQGSSFLATLG